MHKKNADTAPAIAGASAMQKKEASGTSRPACNPNGANQLLLPKTSRQTALGGRGPIPRWPYAVCSYSIPELGAGVKPQAQSGRSWRGLRACG